MTQNAADSPVIARMTPSAPRRFVGVGTLGALGLFLLGIAARNASGQAGLLITLLGSGGLMLWMAVRLWQSTSVGLELTRGELRDTNGRVLTPVDQIRSVERGVFALKPATGFTILTKTSGPRAWAPGLWWRAGKRIGVGGVTHRNEGRFMAEMLAELIKSPER